MYSVFAFFENNLPKIHHSRLLACLMASMWLQMAPANAQDAMGLEIISSPSQPAPDILRLDDLDAFEQLEFSTTTIWTDGLATFSGVPLKTLLDSVDFDGEIVELVALNEYAITIPLDELEDDAPIVASRMNGEAMSVREKGPFWVIYPYDLDPKYQTDSIYARSIWQLARIRPAD